MKVKSYKVTEVAGKITVEVQVKETPDRNPDKDRKTYNSEDIKQFLVKEGYKNIGKVIDGDTITNFQGPKAATGTWIFSTGAQSAKKAPKKVVKAAPTEKTTVTSTVTPVQNTTTKKKTTKKKSSVK